MHVFIGASGWGVGFEVRGGGMFLLGLEGEGEGVLGLREKGGEGVRIGF